MEEESKIMGENNPPVIDLAPRINCPVIGFFGNEDENPSPEDVDDYSKALNEGGVEHHFYRYDNAGHAFQSLIAKINSEVRPAKMPGLRY